MNPSDRLAEFSQLHAAVRAWLARDFAAPGHATYLPQNLAYADLVFAFGYARLGDADLARQLLADATAGLDPGGVPEIVLPFFRYRIEEAIAGRPHAGIAVGCTVADRPDLPHHAPIRLHAYAADRLRGALKVLEPDEAPDPYADWMRQEKPIERMVHQLLDRSQTSIPAEGATELFRELDRNGEIGDRVWAFKNLSGAAMRGDADFRQELLRRMPAVYRTIQEHPTQDHSDTSENSVAEFLCSTVKVARLAPDPNAVDELTATAVAAVCDGWCRNNFQAAARMVGECVRTARLLGLTSTVGMTADRLAEQFPLATPSLELPEGDRQHHRWDLFLAEFLPRAGYEQQLGYLRLQLVITEAGGWAGWGNHAATIVEVVRTAWSLWPRSRHPVAKDLFNLPALIRQCLRALGADEDPATLRRMGELFAAVPTIRNTYQTAPFFSRLHLEIIDTAVLAFPGVYDAP